MSTKGTTINFDPERTPAQENRGRGGPNDSLRKTRIQLWVK